MKLDKLVIADTVDALIAGGLDDRWPILDRDRPAPLHLGSGRVVLADDGGEAGCPAEAFDEVTDRVHGATIYTPRVEQVNMIDVDTLCVMARMDTMHARLREARVSAGFTSAAKAAAALGVTGSTYAAHENGQNKFDPDTARQYAKKFRVSAAWLLTGEEDEPKRISLGQEFGPDPDPDGMPRRVVSADHRVGVDDGEIPQAETMGLGLRDAGMQVSLDLGNGENVVGVPVLDTWRIPPSVLRRRVSAPIAMLHMVECEGNSMAPLIKDGDVVLVDRSKRNPTMPGIFALWEGDGQTIKQVEVVRGSVPLKLRLIPANKDYASYEVLADDVHIIGRYAARFTAD